MKGERSKHLGELKKKEGLPSWKECSDGFDKGFVGRVNAKVALMERYSAAQRHLMASLSAGGVRVANSMSLIVDLQGKLWELEEKLREKGVNPLESREWLDARRQLAGEIQFVHKQGLDVSKFQLDVAKAADRLDDDKLFEVEQ